MIAIIDEFQKNVTYVIYALEQQQSYQEARQIALQIVREDMEGKKNLGLYRQLPEKELDGLFDSMRTRKEIRARIENYKNDRLDAHIANQIPLKDALEPIDPDGLMESNCYLPDE